MKKIKIIGILLILLAQPSLVEAALPDIITSIPNNSGGQNYSVNIELLILLTAITFLPAVVLLMTSFTRIIIVLSLLRMALGTQSSPPNQVLIGLALFLTYFIMGPVVEEIHRESYVPYAANKINLNDAITKGSEPLKNFMLAQTREADLALFVELTKSKAPNDKDNISFKTLVPAFATSELKTAFQIGFTIFIPFLIIDMVVASVLMAMGMMMVSPSIVSLPFKIMLFVLVDGWHMLLGSLSQSFY